VSAARDWDAATYHRVGAPQEEWAREVIERLPLAGDETVLDAGCGSGNVTRMLVERLPRGRVIAVDASESMVEKAREVLGPDADVRRVDLVDLELDEQVDAVFSSAVFHWIPDHDRLFARLHAVLRPGGRLVAQCGGAGNIDDFHATVARVTQADRYARWFAGWRGPWNFRGPKETEASLRAAGFDDVECWLESRPVSPPEPAAFVRTVVLGPHLERLPEELRPVLLEDVLGAAGDPLVLDYVRLNIGARRPA
jgi:trans-aconitate 2-methyltransferase